ncbi:hypothetical protein E143388_08269 [Rhodococcus opacus]|nr:hypothetical protein E143388_08269 [Rhodococcus opacus]
MPDLSHAAAALVAAGHGILATDESIATMSARLTAQRPRGIGNHSPRLP